MKRNEEIFFNLNMNVYVVIWFVVVIVNGSSKIGENLFFF